jgi:hypothetical protein
MFMAADTYFLVIGLPERTGDKKSEVNFDL